MTCLKNIVKVEYIEVKNLGPLYHITESAVKLYGVPTFIDASIIGLSSVEITDKLDNKSRIYTEKLIFKTDIRIKFPQKHLVYRVTTADGNMFLVGDVDRPYTVTTIDEVFPSSITESGLIVYTVTYSSAHNILYIP